MPRKKMTDPAEFAEATELSETVQNLEEAHTNEYSFQPEGGIHESGESSSDGTVPFADVTDDIDDAGNADIADGTDATDITVGFDNTGVAEVTNGDNAIGNISSTDAKTFESGEPSGNAGGTGQSAAQRRQKAARAEKQDAASVLTLKVGAEVETQADKESAIWHEIKSSQITGSHLTGILGKVERMDKGKIVSVIDYKGQRIAIPIKEMELALGRPDGQSEEEYNERMVRVLNRMMGAEIDFVVRGVSGGDDSRAAVASRKTAMHRLRRRYYLTEAANGKPQVYPGRIAEARIIAVGQLSVRVEIFGVETSIRNQDLSWGYIGDCRDSYFVGDVIQVRVKSVSGDSPESLAVKADVTSLSENTSREKLLALKPQTNCMGRVTGVGGGIVFINLVDGVRAIAHKCFDRRKPGRGDDVLFVCTHIDVDGGAAIGIISRIVKRNI